MCSALQQIHIYLHIWKSLKLEARESIAKVYFAALPHGKAVVPGYTLKAATDFPQLLLDV